jgi:hypothetical protein
MVRPVERIRHMTEGPMTTIVRNPEDATSPIVRAALGFAALAALVSLVLSAV